MKGHNYGGLCRKCGQIHVDGMKGKKHSLKARRKMRLAHKGRPPASPETRRKIGKNRKIALKNGANHGWKGHNWGLCEKCGKNHGEPPAKGVPKSEETRRKIGLAHKGVKETPETRLKNSLGHRKRWRNLSPKEKLKKRDRALTRTTIKVRRIYRISEDIQFIPVSVYEHYFASKVLNGNAYSRGLMTRSGLRERQEWQKSNENVSEIPVVI